MQAQLNPDDLALRDLVHRDFERAQQRHEPFRRNCERRYRQYRSYLEMRNHWRQSPRDRDDILRGARREWGAELFIPYCFSVVETILPRMLSASPTLNVMPCDPASDANTDNVSMMIHRQQDQINYHLRLQDVCKSGLIYGLGVQKVYWKQTYKQQRVLQPAVIKNAQGNEWVASAPTKKLVFDDPFAEAVDVFDFLWDPFAGDIEEADYVIHRTWRSPRYVRQMVAEKLWRADWDGGVDALLAGGPVTKRDEVWAARDVASGYGTAQRQPEHDVHEVWEYHDGSQVITLLDGWYPVVVQDNPYWHQELPFQAYRPTRMPHEFVGIGEIEPIEHLQEEMNTLRSQRRDNATLKLQQVFAYFDGMVDPDHLKFGPGMAIPVNGPPGDLLQPINVGDIPHSGYQEEENLMADIVRTVGIDDSQAGVSQLATTQTATGAQLGFAAANVRIQQKARRLGIEVIKRAAHQFLALDQQKIRSTRQVAGPAKPDDPEARWSWYAIGPKELAGEFVLEPEEASTMPENIPQQRQDGEMLLNSFQQNPYVDQVKLITTVLEKLGIKNPQPWIQQPPPEAAPGAPGQQEPGQPGQGQPGGEVLVPGTLALIVQGIVSAGIPEDTARHLVMGAIAHADQVAQGQQQGPEQPQGPSQGGPQPQMAGAPR